MEDKQKKKCCICERVHVHCQQNQRVQVHFRTMRQSGFVDGTEPRHIHSSQSRTMGHCARGQGERITARPSTSISTARLAKRLSIHCGYHCLQTDSSIASYLRRGQMKRSNYPKQSTEPINSLATQRAPTCMLCTLFGGQCNR